MKKTNRKPWTAAAALVTAAVLSLHPAAAQKTAKEAEQPQTSPEYAKLLPGENHKPLHPLVGKWEATLRGWGHGSPPPEFTFQQTLDTRWVMRNNWLQTDFTTKFPQVPEPFRGIVYRGYNAATENYVAILLSDGDVRETVSKGTWDPAKKTFVFIGPEKDPVTQDTFQRKEIYTLLDADSFKYQLIYVYQDGSESRAAEGTFTRVKDKK
ncbi:MAG TPA: DUF1579 family protein [Thermoanaerobaculia bacterium]|nr:DUF1579 family protein [Thermoanaerobaculia bacterium]